MTKAFGVMCSAGASADAEAAAPGFCSRLADQLARRAARGVHVPGSGARPDAATVTVAPAVLAALRARADSHRAS